MTRMWLLAIFSLPWLLGASVTAAAVVQVPTLRYTWVEQAPPLFEGDEHTVSYVDGAPKDGEWHVYVVDSDRPPLLLRKTAGMTDIDAWIGNDLITTVRTAGQAGGNVGDIRRLVPLDAATGQMLLPDDLPVLRGMFHAAPDAAHSALAVERLNELEADLYVIDREGNTKVLAGLGSYVAFSGWISGDELLVRLPLMTPPRASYHSSHLYRVALSDGAARLVATEARSGQVSSPDRSKVAFLSDSQATVYDVWAGVTRRLGPGIRYPDRRPAWTPDGSMVIFEGENGSSADLYNATNGDFVANSQQNRLAFARRLGSARRFDVYSDSAVCNLQGIRGMQIFALDLADGESKLVSDCDSTIFDVHPKLHEAAPMGDRVILRDARVKRCCHGSSWDLLLLDPSSGSLTPLNGHSYDVPQFEPHGDGVIVTGPELRIFSPDGDLLRTITPPPGQYVWSARWSPDGSRFAYVVGPEPR